MNVVVRATQTAEERRAYRRAYYLAHRAEAILNQRAYNTSHPRTQQDPERHRRLIAEDRQRHPDHYRARLALGYAVRSGRLTREPCAVCQAPRTEGHHHAGYARENWLVVTWLCRVHHNEAHWMPLPC